MLPKARIPDPGPKALESIRLSVFVPGGKTAGQVSLGRLHEAPVKETWVTTLLTRKSPHERLSSQQSRPCGRGRHFPG